MIGKLLKVGYLFVGIGIGVFTSSIILEMELDKPVGEIEEFIPEDDANVSDNREASEEASELHQQDSEENRPDIWEGRARGSRNVRRNREPVNRQGGRNGGEEVHQEFNASESQVLDYYTSDKVAYKPESTRTAKKKHKGKVSKDSERRKEFDKMREEGNANLTRRYSKMFDSDDEKSDKDMTDILHEVSSKTDTQDSYSRYQDEEWTDIPTDDFIDEYEPPTDIYDEYVLERVEENIEIFLEDNPDDFVTLVWYQGDETLCDEDEQVIPNHEDVIGDVAVERLLENGPGADNGVIFVHNLKTCINYEVVLDMSCYAETVLGMFVENRNRLKNGGERNGSSG